MRLEASYYTAIAPIPPQGIQVRFARVEEFLSVPKPDNRDAKHRHLAEDDGLDLDNYRDPGKKDAGFMTFYPDNSIRISGNSATFDLPVDRFEEQVRQETGKLVGQIFPDYTIDCVL